MEIKKSSEGNTMTLAISGRLETVTAPQLDAEIQALPEGVSELLMEISTLEYVSSAGLRVFLMAHKKMKSRGGAMKISGANASVKKVFDITGFSPILNFV
jgi:anti-sigma B factor antagonist